MNWSEKLVEAGFEPLSADRVRGTVFDINVSRQAFDRAIEVGMQLEQDGDTQGGFVTALAESDAFAELSRAYGSDNEITLCFGALYGAAVVRKCGNEGVNE